MVDLDGLSLKDLVRLDAVLRLAVAEVKAEGEGALATVRVCDGALWISTRLPLPGGIVRVTVNCDVGAFEVVTGDMVAAGVVGTAPAFAMLDAAADVLPPDLPQADPVAHATPVAVDPPAAVVPEPPQGVDPVPDPWPDSPLGQRLKALDRSVWTVEADHAVIEAKLLGLTPDDLIATLQDCGLKLKAPMVAARERLDLLRATDSLRDVLGVLTAVLAAGAGE